MLVLNVFQFVLSLEQMPCSLQPLIYCFDIAFAEEPKIVGHCIGPVLANDEMEVIREETVRNDWQGWISVILHSSQEELVIFLVEEDLCLSNSPIVDVKILSRGV